MNIRYALTLGAAICALGAPAVAQPGYSHPAVASENSTYMFGKDFWRGAPEDLHQRLDWLGTRISRGERDGSITRSEARRVTRSLRQARVVEARLTRRDRGQLSRRDRDYMMLRLNNVSSQIHWARTNGVDQKASYRH